MALVGRQSILQTRRLIPELDIFHPFCPAQDENQSDPNAAADGVLPAYVTRSSDGVGVEFARRRMLNMREGVEG